jgi:cell division FtsZ-interacting protein ZapD
VLPVEDKPSQSLKEAILAGGKQVGSMAEFLSLLLNLICPESLLSTPQMGDVRVNIQFLSVLSRMTNPAPCCCFMTPMIYCYVLVGDQQSVHHMVLLAHTTDTAVARLTQQQTACQPAEQALQMCTRSATC